MTDTPLNAFLQRHPDTQYLDAMLCDLSCVMRGKRYPVAMAEKVFNGGMMLPGSSLLLAVSGDSLDPEGMGFSDGDPDEVGVPIDGTLAPAPWTRYPTAQVLLTLQSLGAQPYYFEPRNVLARVLKRFDELRLTPVVAFELEFYLLDPAHDNGANIRPPVCALSGRRPAATQVYSIDQVEGFSDYLHEVNDACAQQGIATGAISSEYAPGQFEINLSHSDKPLQAADQCVMFRRAVCGVARKHGMQATFMAKPYGDHAGNGLHLHISLLDANGRNVFAGDGESEDDAGALLMHAIGGLRQTMADSMAIFAPNINSYRRFACGGYAPTTPSWGVENRAAAIRIPKSAPSARRIEHRVAGADANPYLTLAALLAGIHYGIVNRLDAGEAALQQVPTPANTLRGETFRANDRKWGMIEGAGMTTQAGEPPPLPLQPQSAFEQCRHSQILPAYFGQRYLNAYTSCKLNEYRAFVKSGEAEGGWYL